MVNFISKKKKITVLPVYPQFPTTFWSYKHAIEFVGKKAIMPPTGLATVAAMLPPEYFNVLPICDLNIEPLDENALQEADIVFTSTMIVQEKSHNEVIAAAHALGKKVIGGGPFPTSYPERNSELDYSVMGEAEITLPAFVSDLLQGKAKKVYTEHDVINGGGHQAVDLLSNNKTSVEKTPVPLWHLLDLQKYYSIPVQYSRGCPFRCDFCDITALYGRLSRTKSAAQVTRELDALLAEDYRGPVFIVDDNFIGNKTKVRKDLLPALVEWQQEHDYPFSFNTEASMNLAWEANREILDGMVEAGFHEVFLGIESPDEEVLERMAKDQNTKVPPLDAVKRIQEGGLTVTGGFIIGSDGEKPKVFEQMFDFIQDAGIPVPMPGLLAALKNTDLYVRLKEEGRLREGSMGDNTHHLRFNFEPELDEDFLINGYVNMLDELFTPENYYERCRTLHKRKGPVKVKRQIRIDELMALVKSARRQLFAKGGVEYAKYIGEAVLHDPRKIPAAVADAIKFYHFRKLTDETVKAHEYSTHADSLFERFRNFVSDITSNYSDRIHEGIELTEEKAGEIITHAREKCEQIHEDYRHDAERALDALKERISSEIELLKQQHPAVASPS